MSDFQTAIFEKEHLIYEIILPLIQKAREEKGLKPIAVPKCYYCQPEPGVLIMCNLKDMGFDLLKNRKDLLENDGKLLVDKSAFF
jgi:hypothetical protein